MSIVIICSTGGEKKTLENAEYAGSRIIFKKALMLLTCESEFFRRVAMDIRNSERHT